MILAIVLLATIKLENFMAGLLANSVKTFDPTIIRLFAIAIVVFIFIYYAFIKRDKD